MHTDLGIYGAKRQSMKKASPRDILFKLMQDYPSATESDLCKRHKDAIIDDPDQFDAIHAYWFANNYRSLQVKQTFTPDAVAKRKISAKKEISKTVAVIKTRAVRMVLLDMTMPNGKLLRDSTGKDCAKAGGWLAKIAKTIKPTDVVGKVLSESQIRKLWQAA
jgi:hypothetical protein